MSQTINVNEVIDNARFQPFHWQVLFWCLLVIIFDGYDLVIYGVALPLLMEQWSLTSVQAGMLASSALVGMMFGAMIFGGLADKFGRKKIIMVCTAFFSGFTFLGAFAPSPTEFAILRFLAGLGIGGVMPNLVALTSEYAPKKSRATMVSIMFSGYAVGGIISALLGSFLVKDYGWEIMFYLAGIPLAGFPLIWKFLPESLTYLVKDNKQGLARHIIKKVEPSLTVNDDALLILAESSAPPASQGSSSFKQLFTEGRAFGTLMFWVAFFMCLLMTYTLSSWLPKLMLSAGYSLGASILFLFALNIGAMIGAIAGGFLADKFHLKPVIVTMCALAALSISALAFNSPPFILYSLVAVAGATTIGTSILLYSYLAQFYPLHIRTTGIGSASAVSRIGAIVGPIITGFLLSLNLPHAWNFWSIAIPALIATVAMAVLKRA
ncbi:MFS transporter [Moraxella sp. FZLJ2107]|uniref:MFS transporter n=1 Tax=unclassified Moraxella TaxID=2685852 RepID=UPI00209C3E47|nr:MULTISPECIES: MFS transporter [unclassified Moraxella]USZ15145.1 MFS transporter [Moraxella sp. FZFQ2102]UTO05865.1 MFS transporter [Moraxella sp. FZLJ2107]UTO22601.1 MFS transporter [Moraxella sp. FZLJ2109]